MFGERIFYILLYCALFSTRHGAGFEIEDSPARVMFLFLINRACCLKSESGQLLWKRKEPWDVKRKTVATHDIGGNE